MSDTITRDDLISADYLEEQRRLHAAPRGYGGRGSKWSPVVLELVREFSVASLLDYGCGQGSLVRELVLSGQLIASDVELVEYDPAIPGKDAPPTKRFDLVVCTDVLEHIESAKINAVMRHLSTVTARALFVVVSLVPTAKTLSDGQQAHILLRSVDWWKYQFDEHDFKLSRTVTGRDPKKDHKQFAAVFVR
jgi:hypothetical protein